MYTAPTLIRTLESHSDEFVTRHDRLSLKILGTVGEPINPRAWEWFYKVIWSSFLSFACGLGFRVDRHVYMIRSFMG